MSHLTEYAVKPLGASFSTDCSIFTHETLVATKSTPMVKQVLQFVQPAGKR